MPLIINHSTHGNASGVSITLLYFLTALRLSYLLNSFSDEKAYSHHSGPRSKSVSIHAIICRSRKSKKQSIHKFEIPDEGADVHGNKKTADGCVKNV